jgi:hypothetical protein
MSTVWFGIRRERKASACPHHDRKHYCKGMCESCYRSNPKRLAYRRNLRNKLRTTMGLVAFKRRTLGIHLKQRYSTSLETYDTMRQRQNNCCPCGKGFDTTSPNVDHDHACCAALKSCGKCVRGLLCGRCNKVLGMLEQEPHLLPAYLSSYLSNAKNLVLGF